MQVDHMGKRRPIAYVSRSLTEVSSHYKGSTFGYLNMCQI